MHHFKAAILITYGTVYWLEFECHLLRNTEKAASHMYECSPSRPCSTPRNYGCNVREITTLIKSIKSTQHPELQQQQLRKWEEKIGHKL